MKVDYVAQHAERARASALHQMNSVLREARQAMLDDLPKTKRKRILRDIHQARLAAFAEIGASIPPGFDVRERRHRMAFMCTLAVDQKLVVYQRVSAALEEIAVRERLPELAELEAIRKAQISGAAMSATREDVNAIAQVTRDASHNVLTKHKEKRDERRRLSGRAAP